MRKLTIYRSRRVPDVINHLIKLYGSENLNDIYEIKLYVYEKKTL